MPRKAKSTTSPPVPDMPSLADFAPASGTAPRTDAGSASGSDREVNPGAKAGANPEAISGAEPGLGAVSASPAIDPTWNYEAAVAAVEAIVAQIEGGELELAELFDRFEAAVQHLRQCEAFLHQKQQQVDLLIETLEPDF